MASNQGKFIDRSPIICAAGVPSGDPSNNIPSVFQQYRVADEVDALKHDAKIWKEEGFVPPRKPPPFRNPQFMHTNSEMCHIMKPPMLTRYQTLINDLKETTYDSYWNAQIGKTRDCTPGLPVGMNPITTTFGQPSNQSISAKELINPPKSHYEVLRESQIAHELYKKTHNDYNPSEKVDRGYEKPNYDPNKCFGKKTKYDPRGIWVRCSCDWFKQDPIVHANQLQADYLKRSRPQLGKVLAPNNNIELVPEGHTFGDPSKQDFYNVGDLLRDPNVRPSAFKRDFYDWLASLNKARTILKKKRVEKGLNIEDLYKIALYLDKDKTEYLPLEQVFKICACHGILLPQSLKQLCQHLNYVVDGKLNYRKFFDLVDINKDIPDIQVVDDFKDIPEQNKYYISSAQASSCDYLFINNNNLPPAGVPSVRHDLPRPVAPTGACRADIENLGNETSVKAVLNPSIYTNYGLTYRDFFLPRSPETIRSLFEKIGYNFPGNSFQTLWDMGLKHDQTGQVCVDTFKRLLEAQCPPLRLKVDEKQLNECVNLK